MWPFKTTRTRRRGRSKRAAERFRTDMLCTDLGEVADLSGDGLRIRATGRVDVSAGHLRPLTLRWADCRLSIKCRVVWVTRKAGGGAEIGVAFVGLSPRLKSSLEHLGQFGFVPGAVGEDPSTGPSRERGAAVRSVPDHYRALGIDPAATAAEVRHAYYRLARRHHPDASRSADAAKTFQALSEAYRVLKDPESRRVYDQSRAEMVGAA